MPNPTAAILIIGDEILSGRTQDTNTRFLAQALQAKGIDLKEVRVVPDDQGAIVAAMNALRAGFDHVFTSGGIGPTHDDITADSVAAAFGVPIDVREDARAALAAHYKAAGGEITPARLRMARIPEGARLIDNPISGAPGFSIGNVHVLAGVPAIFQAMVASVLAGLSGGAPMQSASHRINQPESAIADALRDLAARYPDLSIGSYPFRTDGSFGTNIVVRGQDAAALKRAMAELAAQFPETDA